MSARSSSDPSECVPPSSTVRLHGGSYYQRYICLVVYCRLVYTTSPPPLAAGNIGLDRSCGNTQE